MTSQRKAIKPNQTGFTLLEFLIVLVISGILISIAVPSWHRMMQNQRIEESTSLWERTLRLAREEALTRGRHVRVCPSSNGQQCDNNPNWARGMIVYEEAEDALLVSHQLKGRVAIRYNRNSEITINPMGKLTQAGSLTICDPHEMVKGQKLTLIQSGRIRRSILDADCTDQS